MNHPERDAATDELRDLVTRLFADKVGHDRVLEAEGTALLRDLWEVVAGLGLPGIGASEEAGGSGGTLTDVVTLLRASGRFAVPLPLLEHHLAGWAVTASGGHLAGTGPWSIAPGTATDTLALDAYFVYPEELKAVARIQVFRDFLVANAQRWNF